MKDEGLGRKDEEISNVEYRMSNVESITIETIYLGGYGGVG